MRNHNTSAMMSLLGALAFSAPLVSAGTLEYTYTFVDGPGCSRIDHGQNTCSESDDDTDSIVLTSDDDPDLDHDPGLEISAWYGTSSSDTELDEALYWETYPGGIGVTNTPGESHVVDNGGYFDFLAFSFDKMVTLAQVSLGYVSNDSDFSVFYLNNPNYSIGSTIDLNEFELATHVSGTGTGDYALDGIDSDEEVTASSSVWLVAAYNPVLGGTDGRTGSTDNFKVESLVLIKEDTPPGNGGGIGGGNGGNVPAPATLALLGFGLLMKRRRNR